MSIFKSKFRVFKINVQIKKVITQISNYKVVEVRIQLFRDICDD